MLHAGAARQTSGLSGLAFLFYLARDEASKGSSYCMARAHGRQERRDASGLEEVLVARVEAGHDARQVLLLDGQAADALALGVREEELRQLLWSREAKACKQHLERM